MADHSGVINTPEVWADQDRITGNIDIQTGGSVTIPGGATVFWHVATGTHSITVRGSDGKLNLFGTLESNHAIPTTDQAEGIRLQQNGVMSGNGTLKHCRFGVRIQSNQAGLNGSGLTIDTCRNGVVSIDNNVWPAKLSGGIGTGPLAGRITNTLAPVVVQYGVVVEGWVIDRSPTDGRFGISTYDATFSTGQEHFAGRIQIDGVKLIGASITIYSKAEPAMALFILSDILIDADQKTRNIIATGWIEFGYLPSGSDKVAEVSMDRITITNLKQTGSIDAIAIQFQSDRSHGWAAIITNSSLEVGHIGFGFNLQQRTPTGIFTRNSSLLMQNVAFPSDAAFSSATFARTAITLGSGLILAKITNCRFGLDVSAGQDMAAVKEASLSGGKRSSFLMEGCVIHGNNDGDLHIELENTFRSIKFKNNTVKLYDGLVSKAATLHYGFTAVEEDGVGEVEVIGNLISLQARTIGHEGFRLRIEDPVGTLLAKRALFNDNTVTDSGQDMIVESNVTLLNNVFTVEGDPITLIFGRAVVKPLGILANYNVFRRREVGILIDTQDFLGEISCNSFEGCEIGIENLALSDQNVINLNTFADSSSFGIKNTPASFFLLATDNFWNSTSGPSGAGAGAGDPVSLWVTFDPYSLKPCEASRLSIGGQDLTGSVKSFNIALDLNAATRVSLSIDDLQMIHSFSDFIHRYIDITWGPKRVIRIFVEDVTKRVEARSAFWKIGGLDALGVARFVVIPDDPVYNYVAADMADIFRDLMDLLNLQAVLGLTWDTTSVPLTQITMDIDLRDMHVIKAINEIRKQAGSNNPSFWVEGDHKVFFRFESFDEGKSVLGTQVNDGKRVEDTEDTFNRIRFIYNGGASRLTADDVVSANDFGLKEFVIEDADETDAAAAQEKVDTALTQRATSLQQHELTIPLDLSTYRLRDLVSVNIPDYEMDDTFEIVGIRHAIRRLLEDDQGERVSRGDTTLVLGVLPVKMAQVFKGQ